MRRAVGEVNVDMIDTVAREELCEVKGIASALPCFDALAVFPLVLIDVLARPFAGGPAVFRFFFPDCKILLGRGVVDGSTQPGNVFVTQTGERGINRANLKFDAEPFQGQHLRIAKRLRDNRIPGVKIAEAHDLWIADCGLWFADWKRLP